MSASGYDLLATSKDASAFAAGAFYLCCDALGVQRSSITLYASTACKTASAWRLPQPYKVAEGLVYPTGHRFVFYNPIHLTDLEVRYRSAWPAIGTLAHEAGHHVAWMNAPQNTVKDWDCEQSANYYQGWAMAVLGAGIKDISLRFGHRNQLDGSKTHPSSYHIMQAIERGWRDAGGPQNTPSSEPDFLKPNKHWWPDEKPNTPG